MRIHGPKFRNTAHVLSLSIFIAFKGPNFYILCTMLYACLYSRNVFSGLGGPSDVVLSVWCSIPTLIQRSQQVLPGPGHRDAQILTVSMASISYTGACLCVHQILKCSWTVTQSGHRFVVPSVDKNELPLIPTKLFVPNYKSWEKY